MSATDELRHLLDKRGAKWWTSSLLNHDEETRWRFARSDALFTECEDGLTTMVISGAEWTPEKAVESTLGRDTCRLKRASWDDGTCTWGCICTACDAHLEHETGIGYNYCPICGAKVVDI